MEPLKTMASEKLMLDENDSLFREEKRRTFIIECLQRFLIRSWL